MLFINLVSDNKAKYSNEDYRRAVLARKIQVLIGRPSTRDYIRIVDNGLLPNCPIHLDDIIAAENIFGAEVGCLKGKTTRRTGPKVNDEKQESLPATMLSQYREVTLSADIMHVNKIPFLVTVSKHIKFITVEAIPNRKIPSIRKAMKEVVQVYQQKGFKIKWTLMDNEFEPLRGDLANLGIGLNEAGRDEHVPQVERMIRTIKERARANYNMLPFKHMPPIMVIEMIKAAVFWLNAFPVEGGISDRMSPRTIVTGHTVDYSKHCKYEFGEYVQAHEEHDNSMRPRTVGALALRPNGNAQGNWYFLSLSTGRILNQTHATKLPMPAEVIDRVHALARRQKANQGLLFTNRIEATALDDLVSDDDSDDESYEPSEHGSDSDDDEESFGDDEDSDDPDGPGGEDDGDDDDEPNVPGFEPMLSHAPIVNEIKNTAGEDESECEEETADEEMQSTGVHTADDGEQDSELPDDEIVDESKAVSMETLGDNDQQTLEQEMDAKYGA
jgi:hypothetical protein